MMTNVLLRLLPHADPASCGKSDTETVPLARHQEALTMGLMTDPNTQATLATFISRFHKPGSLLCYVAGVAYMLALAYPTLNAGTYFSENALLPGLVDREYSESSYNVDLQADEYKKVIANNDGIPVGYLETKFTELVS